MKNNKKIEIKLLPIVVNIILILLGVLFVIFSYYPFKDAASWWTLWGSKTSAAIGTTLIASGVVSMLLEISTLKNLVSNSLKNILNDEFPLDAYSEENLENFKKSITINLYNRKGKKVDKNKFDKSIYSAYEHKLRESVLDCYYEYHICHYDITPDEEKGIFSVKASLSYKIVNLYEKEAEVYFRAKTYSISADELDEKSENAFVLTLLEINGKPVTDPGQYMTKENIPKMERFDYYNYKIKIHKKLGTKKEYTVKMEYQYNMPITDTFQSYKFTQPCKRAEHRLRIFTDQSTKRIWKLRVSAFAAYYCKQKDDSARYKVEQKENDVAKILMNDWIFPGSGYLAIFEKDK